MSEWKVIGHEHVFIPDDDDHSVLADIGRRHRKIVEAMENDPPGLGPPSVLSRSIEAVTMFNGFNDENDPIGIRRQILEQGCKSSAARAIAEAQRVQRTPEISSE